MIRKFSCCCPASFFEFTWRSSVSVPVIRFCASPRSRASSSVLTCGERTGGGGEGDGSGGGGAARKGESPGETGR